MSIRKNIILSVPSGSHKRAFLQPLQDFFAQEKNLQLIVISPAAKYPELIKEFTHYPFIWEENDNEEKIYQKYQPALVITTTTGLDSKDIDILQKAKEKKIKTLTYIESWDNVWKMVRNREKMVMPDKLIVWNEMMKKHIIKEFDFFPQNIYVVGSPRLDYFHHKDKIPSKEILFQSLNLDLQKKLIYISTVELYDTSYIVKIVAQAIKNNQLVKPCQIFASVHPGGKLENHLWYAKKYNIILKHAFGRKEEAPLKDFLYNPSKEDMYMLVALFKYSDVMINLSSTTAIESMLADRPTINVMFGKPFDWIRWRRSAVYRDFQEHYKDIIEEGGTKVVKNKKELILAINTYLKNPQLDAKKRLATCKKMITTIDGTTSQKIFDIILRNV